MTGLELALDLSRSTFNLNLGTRFNNNNNNNGFKYSASVNSRLLSNYDVGLHYVRGELGGYQTVLKKDTPHISSLAMLAFSSSESERSQSRNSDTSGFNSMASSSPTESMMKLLFSDVKLEPIMFNSRNILDLNGNIRGDGKPFFTPAKSNQCYSTSESEEDVEKRWGSTIICPDCAFEMTNFN